MAFDILKRFRREGSADEDFIRQVNYLVSELVDGYLVDLFSGSGEDQTRRVKKYTYDSMRPVKDCYQDECRGIDVRGLFNWFER